MEKTGKEYADTLDVLLQVEAKAASLVKDAQEEADRRIKDSEEKSRASYEERCKAEIQAQKAALLKNREKVKNDYKNALSAYRRNLSEVNADNARFCALLNEYLEKR